MTSLQSAIPIVIHFTLAMLLVSFVQAVLDKKWVFIEDIDRSPPDVVCVLVVYSFLLLYSSVMHTTPPPPPPTQVSLLLPLVKYGTLLLPGYDEPLRTEDSFRMIATRR